VAQQPIQAERADPDRFWPTFCGLWWDTVHFVYYNGRPCRWDVQRRHTASTDRCSL
jgi:hypothetical protein